MEEFASSTRFVLVMAMIAGVCLQTVVNKMPYERSDIYYCETYLTKSVLDVEDCAICCWQMQNQGCPDMCTGFLVAGQTCHLCLTCSHKNHTLGPITGMGYSNRIDLLIPQGGFYLHWITETHQRFCIHYM